MPAKEKTPVEVLLEGLNSGVLTDEAKSKLATLINETVEARFTAKETLLKEEYETKKKTLEEEHSKLKAQLLKEQEENEKVLVDQAEKYKKELEDAVITETVKYKEIVEKQRDEDIAKMEKEYETVVVEQTKEFKEKQDAALVEEVKKFKAELIDKVSDYLETNLKESIPAEIYESAAKVAVLEPLVQSINEAYSRNFVKVDTTSFKLISEAKSEIERLKSVLQEKEKDEVRIKKEKREVERNVKIKSLTEGLSQHQKDKAIRLLSEVDTEKLDAQYAKIRDIVIESNAPKAPQKTQQLVENKTADVKPVEQPKTPIADQTVIDIQNKKALQVLNENENKVNNTPASTREGATPQIHTWANKVKPRYMSDDISKK